MLFTRLLNIEFEMVNTTPAQITLNCFQRHCRSAGEVKYKITWRKNDTGTLQFHPSFSSGRIQRDPACDPTKEARITKKKLPIYCPPCRPETSLSFLKIRCQWTSQVLMVCCSNQRQRMFAFVVRSKDCSFMDKCRKRGLRRGEESTNYSNFKLILLAAMYLQYLKSRDLYKWLLWQFVMSSMANKLFFVSEMLMTNIWTRRETTMSSS